ncbi:hypothetical protein HD595_000811 [Nonomuraea roseoviolacea subsp. carminata]|uniref:Uncharacterized protein n=1 Tax=Nonomuraea roseoviolacea subsp. carminata TaxID=160689 RepID=A0ABT1JV44_9ACTN|nr:hypothetical protein [Nonomuraea roseoviolacea subsp. carminata]
MRLLRHVAARLVGKVRVSGKYPYWPYHGGGK